MTVAELRDQLDKFPDDRAVVVYDIHTNEYVEAKGAESEELLHDVSSYYDPNNEDWFPEQEDLDSLDKVDVVIIDY